MTKTMTGAMSVLANNPRQVVLIAPPTSRRVIALQNSLQQINWPLAKVISYHDIVNYPERLAGLVSEGTIVRTETSGECCATERLLLRLGQATTTNNVIADVADLQLEQGQIIPSKQWYAGLQQFFASLQLQLNNAPQHYCTIDFAETLQLFDKRQTTKQWQIATLPVPALLTGAIESFEQLISSLQQQRIHRVFIKLAHGSGASGTIALAISKDKIQATTTIEMVEAKGQIRLFNSRKLIYINSWQTISMLFEQLLKYHNLQIQAWVPKATYQGQVFDIRVLVIAGEACHTLVRLGKQAITNLHLGNGRGDLQQIKNYLGERWQSVVGLAEQAMQSFPNSLYAGIDIVVSQHSKKPYLLEANAFGDFHPNTYYQGLDTYQVELESLVKRYKMEAVND